MADTEGAVGEGTVIMTMMRMHAASEVVDIATVTGETATTNNTDIDTDIGMVTGMTDLRTVALRLYGLREILVSHRRHRCRHNNLSYLAVPMQMTMTMTTPSLARITT